MRAALNPLDRLGTDGSILVVRIGAQRRNSDAFFSFSAIRVHFSQVATLGRPLTVRRAPCFPIRIIYRASRCTNPAPSSYFPNPAFLSR
ncbi:hypothetical protein E1N52_20660 [Paraburkholderia guartelaensis]|uniref:Uncharacterized protein n=1 Tax=Paraburkholderia guartelaensis TaxID=2546446 RepID=A0A4V2ZVS5_9BURK|nr:hypothetical protein E1N52_20660 [Paraburkholderia guartelaensis]